ncbi:MAG: DUF721 domain-containing protein [Treponema sp.]|jgi:hypothetical protein|nr:DUF721 domain-containing protein [Treponema sp.]
MMKRAGDLLSVFFDEYTGRNARSISKVFTSWAAIAKEQRIPAAVDHAQIVELERNIVLIEADHPGWIQILQTKQQELLESFRRRFPELTINGVSFRLSRGAIQAREDDGGDAFDASKDPVAYDSRATPPDDDVLSKIEHSEAFKKLVSHFEEGNL